jgi:hypothetical protein
MKKLFLLVVLLFTVKSHSQSIDPPSGITTHLINGEYVVDGNYYTAIQQAITAAGTTGIVEIPSNYTGNDTYTNPNNITIFDYRMGNPSYLNGSITVPSDPTLPYQLSTKHYVDGSIAGITGAKGAANGFAQLNSSGEVPIGEMPPIGFSYITGTIGCGQLPALTGDITSVGCVTTAGGNVALLDGINTFTNLQHINFAPPQNATLLQMWEPNLPAGGINSTWFGVAASNYNYGALTFTYWGSGLTTNTVSLGLGGVNPLAIYGTGAISWDAGTQIPTSTDVCQTSGTNCPAGLNPTLYAQLASNNNFTGVETIENENTGTFLQIGQVTTTNPLQLIFSDNTSTNTFNIQSVKEGTAYETIALNPSGGIVTVGAGGIASSGVISAPFMYSSGNSELPASYGTQGAYLMWNYDTGGQGSTNFVNLYGGGIGGFTWQNGANTSALSQLMTLSPAGLLSTNDGYWMPKGLGISTGGGDELGDDNGTVSGWNFGVASGSSFGWRFWNGTPGVGPQIAQLTAAGAFSLASTLSWGGGGAIASSNSVALLSGANFSSLTVNSVGLCLSNGVGCIDLFNPIRGTVTLTVPEGFGPSECAAATVTLPGLTSSMTIVGSASTSASLGGGAVTYSYDTTNTAYVSVCPLSTVPTGYSMTFNVAAF